MQSASLREAVRSSRITDATQAFGLALGAPVRRSKGDAGRWLALDAILALVRAWVLVPVVNDGLEASLTRVLDRIAETGSHTSTVRLLRVTEQVELTALRSPSEQVHLTLRT